MGVINTAVAIVIIHFHRIVQRSISIWRRFQRISYMWLSCGIARLIETDKLEGIKKLWKL